MCFFWGTLLKKYIHWSGRKTGRVKSNETNFFFVMGVTEKAKEGDRERKKKRERKGKRGQTKRLRDYH